MFNINLSTICKNYMRLKVLRKVIEKLLPPFGINSGFATEPVQE